MTDNTLLIAACPHCAFKVEYHAEILEGAVEVFAYHLEHTHGKTGKQARRAGWGAFMGLADDPELKRDPEGINA